VLLGTVSLPAARFRLRAPLASLAGTPRVAERADFSRAAVRSPPLGSALVLLFGVVPAPRVFVRAFLFSRAFALRRPRERHLARARRHAHGLATELQVPRGASFRSVSRSRDDENRGSRQQVERQLVARALDVRAPRVTA
jgi:hypothetical protein